MHPVKTQIRLGIRPVQSESSVAKDLSFLHVDSEHSDQTGWMLDARLNALVLSRSGSFAFRYEKDEEQTKINAHTSDEAAVFVDLLCFMKAYDAQIRR